jgi:CheY-like chemotaxis protein
MPIIALTASALREEADRCHAAGMDDYLTKPADMDALERTIKKWLKPPMLTS